MKSPRIFFLLLAVLTLSLSCSKEQTERLVPEAEWLIFGKYHGFCMGNCTQLYKIDSGQLFEDDIPRGLPENLVFKSTPLSREKYLTAKELYYLIPDELLEVDNEIIGCPDCADQGGYYIEIKTNTGTRRWMIDTVEDQQPDFLRPFLREVAEVVEALQ